jgi:hypothetical protein
MFSSFIVVYRFLRSGLFKILVADVTNFWPEESARQAFKTLSIPSCKELMLSRASGGTSELIGLNQGSVEIFCCLFSARNE